MTMPISPGVYSKVIDLTNYVQTVPGTLGFMCIVCDQGPETLTLVDGVDTLHTLYGKPNFQKYRRYAQALSSIEQFLEVSGGFFVLRCVDENAEYSNLYVGVDITNPSEPKIIMDHTSGLISDGSIDAFMQGSSTIKPAVLYRAKYKGAFYNELKIKITPAVNREDQYVIDIYRLQKSGALEIIESRYISFNREIIDYSGDTVYAPFVMEKYSDYIEVSVNDDHVELMNTIVSGPAINSIIDVIDNEPASPVAGFTCLVGDSPSGANFSTHPNEIAVSDGTTWTFSALNNGDRYIINSAPSAGGYAGHEMEIGTWNGTAMTYVVPAKGQVFALSNALYNWADWEKTIFDGDSWMEYDSATALFSPENVTDTSYKPLTNGNDGALININNYVDDTTASQLLVNGYLGTIDPDVYNTESIDMSIVFEVNYPKAVKDAANNLVSVLRQDCVLICDNGDNNSVQNEIIARQNNHAYNTYFTAIYCNFSKIANKYTGANLWVSPVYHMSRIIPLTHKIGELWTAPAGLQRATIPEIIETRYKPRRVQRDLLYLEELNPIAKFRDGYVIWGQLTSQSKASGLSDLSFVITLNFIKRALERYCDNYIFEFNNVQTWSIIQREISSFLQQITSQNGLSKFSVEVGATDYELKTKQCHVDIILTPTRILEKIKLNFFVTD